MKNYYVSLVRGLLGYYVKVVADSKDVVRDYCRKYMGRMWCSIYSEDRLNEMKDRFTVKIINEDSPIKLGDSCEFE